jgi:predicted NAD/FAD-dependent oxidoreductase
MRIGIVGAGLAGLACAERLVGQGHEVELFDKGRGPGGRMSTRRIVTSRGEAHFDHGAQYFTIRDDAFRRRVDSWIAEGAAALWPSAGTQAYVGVPAMNSPVRLMANEQSVRWNALVTRIEASDRGWRFVIGEGDSADLDLAVVATPAEQAASLLASLAPDLAARALSVSTDPCWTVMLAFSEPVPVAQNCWRGEGHIAWAARNNSKPGRFGPESWVVQASPDWSRAHLEADSEWVADTITSALSDLLGAVLPPSLGRSSHRWRFARSGAEGSRAIFDADRRLGLCGDWLIGPRVEAAWLSGAALAERIG